jgi:hypothetical protein
MRKLNFYLICLLLSAAVSAPALSQVVQCSNNPPPTQGLNLCNGWPTTATNTDNTITINNARLSSYPPPSPPLYDVWLRYSNGDSPPFDCNDHVFTGCSITTNTTSQQIIITLPSGQTLIPDIVSDAFQVKLNIKASGASDWQYFYHAQNDQCFQVLPIVLASFTAALQPNNTTRLEWVSISEINASHFEIEATMNGCSYTTLATIPASGLPWGSYYQYTHTYPYRIDNIRKVTQYRIRCVDLDGSFIYSEIRTVSCNTCPPPPNLPCNQPIQGPTTICNSTPTYYFLSGSNYATFVNWSVPAQAPVAVAYTNCLATVFKQGDGATTLSAQVAGCPTPSTLPIAVGIQPLSVTTNDIVDKINRTITHTATVNMFPGTSPSEYNWIYNGTPDGTGQSRTYVLPYPQWAMYYISYNGPCGLSGYKRRIGWGFNGTKDRYTAGPVPANNMLVIRIAATEQQSELTKTAGLAIIEVYDMQGNLRKKLNSSFITGQVSIPTFDLPAGNYLLKIKENGQTETKQIRIEH